MERGSADVGTPPVMLIALMDCSTHTSKKYALAMREKASSKKRGRKLTTLYLELRERTVRGGKGRGGGAGRV
jgi:hypothetical protein